MGYIKILANLRQAPGQVQNNTRTKLDKPRIWQHSYYIRYLKHHYKQCIIIMFKLFGSIRYLEWIGKARRKPDIRRITVPAMRKLFS